MSCRRFLILAVSLVCLTTPVFADPLTVQVDNQSRPTACAEEDNVYLRLQSSAVKSFHIEARHPSYIGTLTVDQKEPDFAHCDFTKQPPVPTHTFTPHQVTLYEDADWRLIGFTFETFWRTGSVPVRVGSRVENDIHLFQLWSLSHGTSEEVLVLYPTDGYWRARPLTPTNLPSTAYGSSFLVGPIEVKDRPFIDIKDVTFDPLAVMFTLRFAKGGEVRLRVAGLDRTRIALDVTFDRAIADGPFAAIRSMFVAEDNADTARVAWRDVGTMRSTPVLDFTGATAVEVSAERVVPSHHNSAAPDMVFGNFLGAGP
jgi:hypothetical protein